MQNNLCNLIQFGFKASSLGRFLYSPHILNHVVVKKNGKYNLQKEKYLRSTRFQETVVIDILVLLFPEFLQCKYMPIICILTYSTDVRIKICLK